MTQSSVPVEYYWMAENQLDRSKKDIIPSNYLKNKKMRYSGKCVKCESPKVIEVKGSKMNQGQIISLAMWSFKNATLDRYICADCGYTEEYVQLDASFQKWAAKQTPIKGKASDDDYFV